MGEEAVVKEDPKTNSNGKPKRTKGSIAKESVNWAGLVAALTMALTTWSDNNTIGDNQAKLEKQADSTAKLATILAEDNTAERLYEQLRPVIEATRAINESQDRRICQLESRIDALMLQMGAVPTMVAEGPADDDGDGIPNVDDECPQQPEPYNGVDDEDGCPDEKVASSKAPTKKEDKALPKKLDELTPGVLRAREERKRLVEQVQMQAQEDLYPRGAQAAD